MKALWQNQARRIDALTLRERVFLFLSCSLVLAALADAMVYQPLLQAHKAVAARAQAQTREMSALRLAVTAPAGSAAAPLSALQAVRSAMAEADATLAQRLAGAGSAPHAATAVADLVQRLLRRHERLTLHKLTLLPPQPGPGSTGTFWHGADLQLQGSYPDLVAYLAALQAAQPALRVGALHIGAGSPALLTVQLHVLGATP